MHRFFNSCYRLILSSLFFIVSITPVFAGEDPVNTAPLLGSAGHIVVNGESNVKDANLFYALANPASPQIEQTYFTKNLVALGIDENTIFHLKDDFTATVVLRITKYNQSNTVIEEVDKTFQINYKRKNGEKYDVTQYYPFENACSVKVKIMSINSTVGPLWDSNVTVASVLKIDNMLTATRDYVFDCARLVPGLELVYNAPTDELSAGWADPRSGQTEYDLEWAWVDEPSYEEYQTGGDFDEAKVFNNNATRVTLKKIGYSIPLLYDGAGRIFVRIRPAQIKFSGQRIEGAWHSFYTDPLNGASPVAGMVSYEFGGHEGDMNWQASTSYAEDGKRKSVIQYFDGSLRSRQTVTKDNSAGTPNTIVAETFYDYQGRPVIQVLPAPTLATIIQYSHTFNKTISTSYEGYPKWAYDKLETNAGVCGNPATAMSTAKGAGNYYSPANPLSASNVAANPNQYIPTSEGTVTGAAYPFTETRFAPDGRPLAQGGVGIAHQLGSTHETKYFYESPAQEELDALFGTDAGVASHYFKNLVRDANGQYSVNYSDMHGRTVATALAGTAPTGMDSLLSSNTKNFTRQLIDAETNVVSGNSIVSTKNIIVPKKGLYSFKYEMHPEQLKILNCNDEPICYDCIYKLEITVSSDCYTDNDFLAPYNYVDDNFTLGEYLNSPVCRTGELTSSFFLHEFNLTLPEGSYTITKRLTLSDSARRAYRDVFMANNTCKTFEDFYDTEYQVLLAQSNCAITCESCTTSVGQSFEIFRQRFLAQTGMTEPLAPALVTQLQAAYNEAMANCGKICDDENGTDDGMDAVRSIRKTMLLDVSPPGGQYAKKDDLVTAFNVLATSNLLNYTTVHNYKDEFGQPEANDPALYPADQFSESFKPVWAESLLPLHPEYPKLATMENLLPPAYQFEATLLATNEWTQAAAAGYINAILSQDPFFNGTIAGGTSYISIMAGKLNGYQTITGAPGCGQAGYNASAMQLAQAAVFCRNIVSSPACHQEQYNCLYSYYTAPPLTPSTGCLTDWDQVWKTFRSLYLTERKKLISTYIKNNSSPDRDAVILNPNIYPNNVPERKLRLRIMDMNLGSSSMGNLDAGDLTTFFTQLNAGTDAGAISTTAGNLAIAQYEETCNGYKDMWIAQLEQCPLIATRWETPATRTADVAWLTERLVKICREGSDAGHYLGSSSINPSGSYAGYPNPGGTPSLLTAFPEVITQFLVNAGISLDAVCHPYLISSPKPYELQAPVTPQLIITKPSECECSKLTTLKNEFQQVGSGYGSFSNYLKSRYGTDITAGDLNTLLSLCAGTNPCQFLPTPFKLPAVMQCIGGNTTIVKTCIDCKDFQLLRTGFQSVFGALAPIKEPADDNQVNINTAFAKYANTKTGFSKNISEYISFLDQCGGINPGTCDTLNNIVKNFILNVKKGKVTHNLNTDNGATYNNLLQITDAGTIHFPDSVRNIYSGWYNNYGFGLSGGSTFCTASGYAVEIKFKYNTNKTGDIFYSALGGGYGFTAVRNGSGIWANFSGSNYLMDANPNAVYNWMTLKVKVLPNEWSLYCNGNLVRTIARDPGVAIGNLANFGLGIIGRLYVIDYVKVWNATSDIKYFEDFNNPSQPAYVDSSFICPKPNCELEFRNYFNQQRGTSYTYAQIDSFYRAKCGQSPMPCAQVSSCSAADILVKNYQNQYITPAGGYVDYDLRTFAGNKTPEEGPKGVFDVNNQFIGNAEGITPQAIREAYVEVWNSSAVNQQVGTLSLLPNGRYRLTLLPGKAAPCNGIIGMRYYQFEAPVNILDGIITGTGCFIDFGDGHREFITKGLNARNTVVYDQSVNTELYHGYHAQDSSLVHYYTKHTYDAPNIQVNLVTVYHPDILGSFGFDNITNTTELDIRYIRKLSGYMPQQTLRVVFHSTQDSSMNSFARIKNFPQIKSITHLNLGNGNGSSVSTELRNMRFPSFINNKNISDVWLDEGTEAQYGYQTIESLLPNLKVNFPRMTSMVLRNNKGAYTSSVNFSIPALKHLNISGVLSSLQLDSIIIQVARTAQDSGGLRLYHTNGTLRTSLSDAAYNLLIAKKWDLRGGGMNNIVALPADRVLKVRDSVPLTSQFADYYNTLYGTNLSHNQVMQALQTTYGYIPDYCTPIIKTCNDSVRNAGPMLCGLNIPLFNEIPYEDDPCADLPQIAYNAAEIKWELYLDSLRGVFDAAYTAKCMSAGRLESFTVNYDVKEYHYTLYYYDQAGNLVKTVPPAGVNAKHGDATFLDAVAAARERVAAGEAETATSPDLNTVTPFHTLVTSYRYNTLNHVVEQKTPDAGISKYWYDRLGRLVVSQNSKQANAAQPGGKRYSYTLYDELGRIMEVGQKPQTAAISQLVTRDKDNLLQWLNGYGAGSNVWNKEEITRTRYDLSYADGSNILGEDPSILVQRNLRNRVSYSMVFDTEPDPASSAVTHRAATFYTYDIHGNVDTLLQDLRMAMLSTESNRYKKMVYDYDLISGKVNKIAYQPGMQDQFYHRYDYDMENRLTDVYTSHDNILWETDARYSYYKHGPLARLLLGQQKVQGVDYAYTLQGWLKGINSTAAKQLDIITGEGADCGANSAVDNLLVNARTQPYMDNYKATTSISFENGFESTAGDGFLAEIDPSLASCGTDGTAGTVIPAPSGTNYHDMGKDGMKTPAGVSTVASDVFGLGLNYFNGDYKAVFPSANPFANAPSPPVAGFTTGMPLYNGNINSMAVNIPKLGAAHLYAYRYDQLNRLKAMDAFTGLNDLDNTWTPVATDKYRERVSYDANGNILTYERNGNTVLQMDKLTYQYPKYANTTDNTNKGIVGKIINNKLRYVHDDYTTAMAEDIESNTNLDIETVQAEILDVQEGDNYQYDEVGNLIKDGKENITSIVWNAFGKIHSISKGSWYPIISFTYDAVGDRITKTLKFSANSSVTTVYVRSATGDVLSVYNYGGSENNGDLTQKELHLYGNGRLGIYNTNRNVQSLNTAAPNNVTNSFIRGDKFFELSNHLGNVLVTISDKKVQTYKIQYCGTFQTAEGPVTICHEGNYPDDPYINSNVFFPVGDPYIAYEAEVVNANDYYPFGMIMPGRKFNGEIGYRYGFNGKEMDTEVKGEGNHINFEGRVFDPRIGRWFSCDPQEEKFPSYSTYSSSFNNPLSYIDPDGESPISWLVKKAIKYGIKKAAKEFVEQQIKQRLKNYMQKGWARQLAGDAEGALDLLTNEWWETAIEILPVVGDAFSATDLGVKGAKMWKKVQAVYDKAEKRLKIIDEFNKKMGAVEDYISGKIDNAAIWAKNKFERGNFFEAIASKTKYKNEDGWKWFGDATDDLYDPNYKLIDFYNTKTGKMVSYKSLDAKDPLSSAMRKNIQGLIGLQKGQHFWGVLSKGSDMTLTIAIQKNYSAENMNKLRNYVSELNKANGTSLKIEFDIK